MKTDQKQTRKTVIEHIASPKTITAYQVTELALELSKTAHGTIERSIFKENCELAFETLCEIQAKLGQANTVAGAEN